MYSPDEVKSLHGFVRTTGEGNLKKMLVGGAMTEAHFSLLMKVARGCKDEEFVTHLEAATFPKLKLNPGETAIKETFWKVACDAFGKMGLLTKTKAA